MNGREEGIRTLAPRSRSTPLAGEPLEPLGYFSINMAPQVGLEPTTDRLTADSSTTELLRNNYGGPKWTRTIDLTLIRRAL